MAVKFISEKDAQSERIGPPHQRVIRHLVAPWTLGSKNVWVGTSAVDPGFTSNEHSHADQEEIFYCVSGAGQCRVDGEVVDMGPGDVVYVPPGAMHQLVNPGTEVFKVVAVVSPPFVPEKFKQDHDLS